MIIHRNAAQPAWWFSGIGLVAAAWWGWPLIESDQFQNHFFGVFWYSMLVLGAAFWAVPAEQRVTAQTFERRWCLFGLIPLKRQVRPVSDFASISLDQEPGLFGRDTVWVLLQGKDEVPLVFARYRATVKQIALAQAKAEQLSALTGLPFRLDREDEQTTA